MKKITLLEPLAALISSSLEPVLVAGRDGNIVLLNAAAENLLGYSSKELSGRPISDVLPRRLRQAPDDDILRWLKDRSGGKHHTIPQVRIVNKDGHKIPVDLSIAALALGGETFITATLRDNSRVTFLRDALQESDERFRLAFERAVIGKAIADPDGRLILANESFARMIGCSQEELLQLTWMDLTYPEDLPRSIELSRQMAAGEIASFDYKHRLVRADGDLIWVHLNAVIVRDRVGRPAYIIGDITDITDKVIAEQEKERAAAELEILNQLGEKLRSGMTIPQTAEAALAVVSQLDHADLAFVFLHNGEELHLQGLTARDSKFRHRETPVHRVGECLCGLAVQTRAAVYSSDIHCDPRCTWEECKQAGIRSLAALPFIINGEVLGTLGIGSSERHDFSVSSEFLETIAGSTTLALKKALLHQKALDELAERIRVQERLQQSEDRYRDLYENAPNAYLSVGTDDLIIECNQRAAELTGRSVEDLVGSPLLRLYADTPRGAPAAARLWDRFIAGKTIYNEEVQLIGAGGEPIWVSQSINAIVDEGGEVQGCRAVFVDITERKKTEAALHAQEAQYHTLVNNLTLGVYRSSGGPDDAILQANPALAHILGYESAEDLLNTRIADLFVNPEGHYAYLAELSQKGVVQNKELRLKRRDGTQFWARVNTRRQVDGARRVIWIDGIIDDVTEQKAIADEMVYNAFHDRLTGLPNRALFLDRLERAISRGQRKQNHLYAVLFIDLDRFKRVNDSFGHAVGDQALVAIGQVLQTCVRDVDTVARFSGDEFTVLLDDLQEVSDATGIAARINEKMEQPLTIQNHSLFVTGSIGVAFKSEERISSYELIRDADIAMYQAKMMGKSRFEVFDSRMLGGIADRIQVETELRLAIEEEQFRVHYQPLYRLAGRELLGFEALVRWQHPARGLLPPSEFLSVAEETGLIVDIGRAVLRNTCRQLAAWQQAYPRSKSLSVSINLSQKQIMDPRLVAVIKQTLAVHGLEPRRLRIEITESTLIQDVDRAISVLEDLQKLGIRVEMDDFGTGYSSLSMLDRLPIQAVKIDQSFVSPLPDDERQISFVRSIIRLAKDLQLLSIAEGIERVEQYDLLKDMGCQIGQGYYFSKPLSGKDAEDLINEM